MSRESIKRVALAGTVALAIACSPAMAEASPGGVVISPSSLKGKEASALKRRVTAAREMSPRAFAVLAKLRADLPRLEKRQRGRLVTVVQPLRALGADGLMPMLHELAVEAAPRGELSERAWRGWRVSLLEAVGALGDRRAAPVLRAAMAADGQDLAVRRVAAAALCRGGRAGDVGAVIRLVKGSQAVVANELIPALGQCRRLASARALGELLAAANDEPRQRALAAALGEVGNTWAWKTPAVARSKQGEAVRQAAMAALVSAYPKLDASARTAAVKALALVGHPRTLAAISAAQEGGGAGAAALSELRRRVLELGLLK